ncbi:hypothetical protein [Mycobacterium sp.]|uniref:hypothetical protein n=1 Tax=Mycobacterium sp. TaxID=1785 RepID=UPI001276FF2D|nr:hypothetical protein [Mycobacterium sp.]KAA8959243.1 MAG: hypothetical protein F6Q13_14730 [Mycobacterium sp.]
MGRTVAIVWHAVFALVAGVLYFFFVVPRWPELMGYIPHTLGTALRIVTGVVIGLAALPVVFTVLRTRKPEYGTPRLALRMRTWSIVAHTLAGVLIAGTAISEIWLSLDSAGRWLFGIYGAAAAIALLGIVGFYLSFVAELAPKPPKPPKARKPKKPKRRRRGGKGTAADDEVQEAAPEIPETPETPETDAATAEAEATGEEPETAAVGEPSGAEDTEAVEARGGLRNRRPAGKSSRRRRRSRGGVAVDD